MEIQDLRRDETAVLQTILAGMSPDSRYLRFHAAVPTLSPSRLAMLLDVDGYHHVALVARTDGAVVGIARLIRDRHCASAAEIAVAVTDAWHRRGVGRELLRALTRRAGRLGINRVHAAILPSNTAALRLFRASFPVSLTRRDPGAVELVGLLGGVDDGEITWDDVLGDLLS